MNKRLDLLLTMYEENPSDSFILFALAKEYEKNNDNSNAKDYYLKLKQNHPDYVGLYYHLGKLYEVEGEVDLALNTYSTGMEVAKSVDDQHAFNELSGVKLNLELE